MRTGNPNTRNAHQALPYFSSLGFRCPKTDNPADFFMDCISGEKTRYRSPITNEPIPFEPSDLFAIWEERQNNPDAPDLGNPTTQDDPTTQEQELEAEAESLRSALDAAPPAPTFKPKELNMLRKLLDKEDPEDRGLGRQTIVQLISDLQADDQSSGRRRKSFSVKNIFGSSEEAAQVEVFTNRQVEVMYSWLQQLNQPNRPDASDAAPVPVVRKNEFIHFLQRHESMPARIAPSNAKNSQTQQEKWTSALGVSLSVRPPPLFFDQLKVFTLRSFKKSVRAQKTVLVDMIMLVAAATVMALINGREYKVGGFPNDMSESRCQCIL